MLSTNDLVELSTSSFVALGTADIAALTTTQAAALSTTELSVMRTAQLAAIVTSDIAALSTVQVLAIPTADIAALRTAQVAALGSTNVQELSTSQFMALGTASIAALTTAEAVAISTTQIDVMTTAQVAAFTTTQLAALSTNQLVELSTADVRALRTAQVASLTTTDMQALTTGQIEALSSSQTKALSSTQIDALTTTQISHLTYIGVTPLVLDLDGNGVQTLNVAAGVQFDIKASGAKVNTGWVGSGDGLLALDRNGDGKINDGSELFGSAVTLADGSKAANGYQALAALDSNGDGKIDAKDGAFAELKVWVDSNADGISQAAELTTLAQRGIASLDLAAQKNGAINNGNWVGLSSSYETVDGQSHTMADVWFQNDLRGKASAMAQAITGFGAAGTTAATASGQLALPQPGDTLAAAARMADVLQQFDANGKPLTGAADLAGADHSTRSIGLNLGSSNGTLFVAK